MAYRACRRSAALCATEEKCIRPRVDSPKPDKGRLLRCLFGRANNKTSGGCRSQQLPLRRFERAFREGHVFGRIDQTPFGDQVSFLRHRAQHFNLQIDGAIPNPRAQRTVHRATGHRVQDRGGKAAMNAPSGFRWRPSARAKMRMYPLQPPPVSWARFQRSKPVGFYRPSQPVTAPVLSFCRVHGFLLGSVNLSYSRGQTC